MSEKIPSPEAALSSLSNVELLNNITSLEAVARRQEWLQESIADNRAGRLVERSQILREEAFDAWDKHDRARYDAKETAAARTLETAARTYGTDEIQSYHKAKEALRVLDNQGPVEFWGEESRQLFDLIISDTPLIDDGIDREHEPPPAEIPDASAADYAAYLDKKRFIPARALQANAVPDRAGVVLNSDRQEEYEIPVANMVSAGSFDSWRGRDNGEGDKNYTKSDGRHVIGRSIDTIIDYAKRPTPLPPLEDVEAYVQPNGTVLFTAVTANHRAAAAIARGESAITMNGRMSVVKLTENLVE